MTMRPQVEERYGRWTNAFTIIGLLYRLCLVVIWVVGLFWSARAANANHWDPQNFAHGIFWMLLGGISILMMEKK